MATPTNISKPYKFLNGGPLDWWQGPWSSVAQGCSQIPNQVDTFGINFREGKTFYARIGGVLKEYFWPTTDYTDAGVQAKLEDVYTKEEIDSIIIGLSPDAETLLPLLDSKQDKTDGDLETDNKTVVGAINESLGRIQALTGGIGNLFTADTLTEGVDTYFLKEVGDYANITPTASGTITVQSTDFDGGIPTAWKDTTGNWHYQIAEREELTEYLKTSDIIDITPVYSGNLSGAFIDGQIWNAAQGQTAQGGFCRSTNLVSAIMGETLFFEGVDVTYGTSPDTEFGRIYNASNTQTGTITKSLLAPVSGGFHYTVPTSQPTATKFGINLRSGDISTASVKKLVSNPTNKIKTDLIPDLNYVTDQDLTGYTKKSYLLNQNAAFTDKEIEVINIIKKIEIQYRDVTHAKDTFAIISLTKNWTSQPSFLNYIGIRNITTNQELGRNFTSQEMSDGYAEVSINAITGFTGCIVRVWFDYSLSSLTGNILPGGQSSSNYHIRLTPSFKNIDDVLSTIPTVQLETSPNLFLASDVRENTAIHYINYNIYTQANYAISGDMPVIPGKNYEIGGLTIGTNERTVAFLDVNKAGILVNPPNGYLGQTGPNNNNPRVITIPAGVYWIAFMVKAQGVGSYTNIYFRSSDSLVKGINGYGLAVPDNDAVIEEIQSDITDIKKLTDLTTVENLQILNENPLYHVNKTPGFSEIFQSTGFITDSFGSGVMEYNAGANQATMYEYSWGQRILKATGNEGYNFGQGGQTAKGWNAGVSAREWGGAQTNIKKTYIISLGINDEYNYRTSKPGSYPAGNVATDIQPNWVDNSDTFAGHLGGMIQRLKSIQPKAKIFVTTVHRKGDSSDALVNVFNQVIRDMPTKFTNVYIVDIYTYAPVFNTTFRAKYWLGNHMTAVGYQYYAYLIMTYIDWIVRTYPTDFKQEQFVGTPYSY